MPKPIELPPLVAFSCYPHGTVVAAHNPFELKTAQAAEVIRRCELFPEMQARLDKANADVLVATQLGLSIQKKLEAAQATIQAQLEAAERTGKAMADHAESFKELIRALESLPTTLVYIGNGKPFANGETGSYLAVKSSDLKAALSLAKQGE